MDKRIIVIVLLILIISVGGLLTWYFTKEKPVSTNSDGLSNSAIVMIPPKNTVWIVEGNFTPAVVTVAVGDKITWVNKDIYKRRIASDGGVGTESLPTLVSSDLVKDDSFSFSFTNKGEWIYHDSLNPIKKGKIIVQ